MYRLLAYKGYRFPGISQEAKAVMMADEVCLNEWLLIANPQKTIKTAEELEEEEKRAHGAVGFCSIILG